MLETSCNVIVGNLESKPFSSLFMGSSAELLLCDECLLATQGEENSGCGRQAWWLSRTQHLPASGQAHRALTHHGKFLKDKFLILTSMKGREE